jgi:hypothetical protein
MTDAQIHAALERYPLKPFIEFYLRGPAWIPMRLRYVPLGCFVGVMKVHIECMLFTQRLS